jgi:DNA-directed RNA polymerase subunit RPC12/RpoP
MNKALCGCGALADLDTDVVRRKQRLGKRVECVNCRNRRIAKEREILENHFQGLDEEEPNRY